MEYLQPPYTYYVVAALGVIAVLLVVVAVARAIGGRVRGRRGSRLGISEYREIDKQRRLVLVRRDGVEHLLLIGGGEDLVVETGIVGEAPGQRVRRRPAPQPEEGHSEHVEPALHVVKPRPAPRPPVFGDHPPPPRPVDRDPPKFVASDRDSDQSSR
jgi:hypothetical protein